MIGRAMAKTSSTPPGSVGLLTIGALARLTGVPVETLRTWESRYGFPEAERKPSGHRVYAPAVVPRLRRMADALRRGHRAGEVVGATDAALDRLMAADASAPAAPGPLPPAATLDELLAMVLVFDRDRLTAALLADWGRLTPVQFVADRIAPLVTAVGDRWAAGRMDIRHEHFLSERVADILRSLRLPFDLRATGPRVICATLPGEEHGLGLQMAALVLAAAGLSVTYLGTNVPPREVAALAREASVRVVAISVSVAADRSVVAADLARVRRALPAGAWLLVGGAGAPPLSGVAQAESFAELDLWARRVATGTLARKRG